MNASIHRPRRSVIYVPAANPKAMAKVQSLACDAVILDLEDAVAPAAKAEARRHLAEAFSAGAFSGREAVIRVNALDTPDFEHDMEVVAQCVPDAVLLPKVGQPETFDRLAASCRARNMPSSLRTWAMVETPEGLIELDRIVQAGVRSLHPLDCLVAGTNDLVKETGVSASGQRAYLLPWLMNIVLVARRRGVSVLDGVWNDFRDVAGCDAEALQGRHMGFDGKTLIHPTQVDPANRAFSATPEALEDARCIVAAFDQADANAGVINMGGRMVERLHLKQVQRLLAMDAAIQARADLG